MSSISIYLTFYFVSAIMFYMYIHWIYVFYVYVFTFYVFVCVQPALVVLLCLYCVFLCAFDTLNKDCCC